MPPSDASHRIYNLCAFLSLGPAICGYHIGLLPSLVVTPGFTSATRVNDAASKFGVTALFYVGALISYLTLSPAVSDRLGRRYACVVGALVLSLGAAVEACSSGLYSYLMMIVGRLLCGIGAAVIMTTVPVFQSEIATTDVRGRLVTLNQVGFIAGVAGGYGVGYTMSLWRTTWGLYLGWRIAVMVQYLPVFMFSVTLPFISESPRWMVTKNDVDGARDTLTWLRHETHTTEQIEEELDDIRQNTIEYQSSLVSLALAPELRPRLWRAGLLQFLSQVCGMAAIKHYLPPLVNALGIDMELALTSHTIEETFRVGLTVAGMFIVDRYGRRICLIAGSVIMAVSVLMVGLCVSISRERGGAPLDILWITFILAYAVGYCIGIGPVSWIYTAEIFPNATRARGVNLAAAAGAIGSLLISEMWTPGVPQNGGAKYYVFAAINAAAVPILWRYFPETKGRSLEDMDAVFGSSVNGFQHISNSDDFDDNDIDLGDDSGSEFGSARDSIELQDYHNGRMKAIIV
ncbi:hypothetical protein BROUX41_003194 [Berkeleyomyces rouxiae]